MMYRNGLVTGASSGIGRALAHAMARDGVEVVLCARRKDELETLAREIELHGGHARVEVMDVGDPDRTVEQIRRLDDELGGLDLVVANAGVGEKRGTDPHSWEAVRGSCEINYTGAIATITAVLPRMLERRRGHIAGVCSLASFGALPGAAAYCAPKAGLSMFLDCLRLDLEDSGVFVTTINPGFIRTAMLEGAPHALPQLLDVDDAANTMWMRLRHQPARIDFPQPLAWATRLAGGLPRILHDMLVKAVAAPGTNR